MGNVRSSTFDQQEDDIWWTQHTVFVNNSGQRTSPPPHNSEQDFAGDASDDGSERATRQKRNKEDLDQFKLELARKHEKHRKLIADKKEEFKDLREEVQRLKQENERLKKMSHQFDRTDMQTTEIERILQENEELRESIARMAGDLSTIDELKRGNLELKMTMAKTQEELQVLNGEVVNFEKERLDYKNHVAALKDVVAVSKQMLLIRENQLKELRQKINEIEASLAGRELNTLSQDLQKEYEKQLQNMRNLRAFYEERLRAHSKEKEDMKSVLDEAKKQLLEERQMKEELMDTIDRLEKDNSLKYDEIKNLESNLGLSKAECRQYQAELSVINQLFSQLLLGFNNNQEIDMDHLIRLLEENHLLLQDIAINEESNQASALPKVLLDLIHEASEKSKTSEVQDENKDKTEEENNTSEEAEAPQVCNQLNSASEIVENLPKVWRVLIELLSHQCAPANNKEERSNDQSCYKMVETPKGTHPVLSVSKTFIRLKDLILEKKSLERETGRLKHLNTHLECRLQEQESRLVLVSKELSETWHVVGKLQKKHQLLHTQEKILRYELAQKRKLLNELKEELEYSREKWQEAREKNSNTEKEWKQLRVEFASRKKNAVEELSNYNNSVESGYSDGRECSSEDEPGYETDVSECNQKISSSDEAEMPTEKSQDIEQNSEESTVPEQNDTENSIMDVVQEQIAAIEESASNNEESSELAEEVQALKTDSVNCSGEKKTLASTSSVAIFRDTQVDLECRIQESNRTLDEAKALLGSSETTLQESQRTLENVLSAREERLSRLEGQASNLMEQVASTSNKSRTICDRLDVLHEIYGENNDANGAVAEDEDQTSQASVSDVNLAQKDKSHV